MAHVEFRAGSILRAGSWCPASTHHGNCVIFRTRRPRQLLAVCDGEQPTIMSTFNPTTAELGLVNQVFISADPRELGIITGDVAVKVFAGSKLPPAVLGEIWSIADKENNGFLTRKGVAIALRLIGHAQKGEAVTEALVNRREFRIARSTVQF